MLEAQGGEKEINALTRRVAEMDLNKHGSVWNGPGWSIVGMVDVEAICELGFLLPRKILTYLEHWRLGVFEIKITTGEFALLSRLPLKNTINGKFLSPISGFE